MDFTLELDQETNGRWKAGIATLPGCSASGPTPVKAAARAKAMALKMLAARMESECDLRGISRIAFTEHMRAPA